MAPGLRLTYWNPRLLRTLLLQLQQQQQAGLFCDVTLQGADGDGLHVHSCVIAACSPYLAHLLAAGPAQTPVGDHLSGPVLCIVPEVSSHHLLPLVRYMYTSELEVAPAEVHGVLQAAKKLQIPELEALKLEGGRLVRPDPGRRLNRDCLGSQRHAQYAVTGVKTHGLGLINEKVNAKNKPSGSFKEEEGFDEVEKSCQGFKEVEKSCQGFEVEPCRQGMQEVEPCRQSMQEVETGSQSMQEVETGSQSMQEVETGSQSMQEVETGSQSMQEVETGSQSMQEVETGSQRMKVVEPCRLGMQEMEIGSQGMQEVEPCSLDAQEMELRRQGAHGLESGQDMQNVLSSQDVREKPNISSSTLKLQISPGTTADKQDQCSPKTLQDQSKEPVASEKSQRYYMKSEKGLQKRIRLDRGRKTISADFDISKPKRQRRKSKTISISTSENFERKHESVTSSGTPMVKGSNNREISSLRCDDSRFQKNSMYNQPDLSEPLRLQQQPDSTAGEEHENRKDLMDCRSSSRKLKTMYERESTDSVKCEMTELTVCSATVSYSTEHRGVKEMCFDLMTEEQETTVDQLASAIHSESEPSMGYLDENMNESGKSPWGIKESHSYGVEKVKLRKANNGLSWEVVKEVEPPRIESSEGIGQQLIVLEQVQQQVLNVPSPMSPPLDVGGSSPLPFMVESVWPDLSTDSDIDVDVEG